MRMKLNQTTFYSPNEIPRLSSNPEFSVDVFIIDENGLHGIACYDYLEDRWLFHTDTLEDYLKQGVQIKWKWYYPPYSIRDIVFNDSTDFCINLFAN